RGSGDRPRRSLAKYFGYTKCRDGVYRRKGHGHLVSSGLQKPNPAAARGAAGAIKLSAMTRNGFVGNRRYNSASSVRQMHVQTSKFPSFPHAFSGNLGATPTGPPTLRQVAQGRGEQSRTTINTFGGDGPRTSSFRLSTPRFCLFLFLCLFMPGQT